MISIQPEYVSRGIWVAAWVCLFTFVQPSLHYKLVGENQETHDITLGLTSSPWLEYLSSRTDHDFHMEWKFNILSWSWIPLVAWILLLKLALYVQPRKTPSGPMASSTGTDTISGSAPPAA